MIPNSPFRNAVSGSPDLERVLALARRVPVDLASPRAEALVDIMTERLRRPDRPSGARCECRDLGRQRCIDRLLPGQAWALYEAPLAGGLLGALGVGSGKTLLDILAPIVMPGCRTASLLIPPGLVGQLVTEYMAIREHFTVPSLVLPLGHEGGWITTGAPVLHVIPYSRFSRAEATELLERLKPDLIIADEVHCLKNRAAVRTGRTLRYFAAHPETRLCGWSGTITSKSVQDFAHLLAFALGEASPLPLDPDEVAVWAAALDPSDWPAPAGALRRLAKPGEDVLAAVQRRISDTLGVVSTRSTESVGASMVLRERSTRAPKKIAWMIRDLRATWVRPDGEELVEALAVSRAAQQLACGFYYRWRFPGKPDPLDVEEWFAARKAWGRELREKLRHPQPHLDSPMLCANAAERFEADYVGPLPVWDSDSWARWRDVKDTIRHETETVWVDDYLVQDAANWARCNRGVVWYEHAAFGRAVADAAGLPLHGGGPKAEAEILAEKGDRSIIASISSHGTGRNGLQYHFAEQLVANPPSDGAAWEQLLGRLHRIGQDADEVVTYVYRHVPEMIEPLERAVRLAKYVDGITSVNQKLLTADCEWF